MTIVLGAIGSGLATRWLARQAAASWSLVQQPQADLDDAGIMLAVGAATLVGLWLTVQLALLSLAIVAQRSQWASRALLGCAQRLTPVTLRKLVAVTAGVCLSAGAAQAAHAAPGAFGQGSLVAAAGYSQRVDPGWGTGTLDDEVAPAGQAPAGTRSDTGAGSQSAAAASDPAPTAAGPTPGERPTGQPTPRVDPAMARTSEANLTDEATGQPDIAGTSTATQTSAEASKIPAGQQNSGNGQSTPQNPGGTGTSASAASGQSADGQSENAADTAAKTSGAENAAAATQQQSVRVERGDSLWRIAQRHLGADASSADVAREWPRWYAANRQRIGNDPNLILPGQELQSPDGPGESSEKPSVATTSEE